MTITRKTMTDSGGDEFGLVYYDPSSQDPATGVYVEISADGELIAAGPFTPEALHAALDEVAPASSDTRTRTLRNDRHYWQARAEKAEQERDQARKFATAEHVRATEAERERDEARADAARPLSPDAISDEMVGRAREEFFGGDVGGPVSGPSSARRWRAALAAALTEPTRPEGAEKLAEVIDGLFTGDEGIYADDLADSLARCGVRVVTEERP